MGVAGAAAGEDRRLFSVDVGWRNLVFALRTAAASILALAIVYWAELSEPQWATLTVFLLVQPTVGATLAKGVWRAIGTVAGGAFGLALVGLFSQAPELLIGAVVLLIGAVFYLGARLRNFASYGVLLGGYTMLLIAYEGSSDPLHAWSIAADRVAAILIGVGCGALASAIVFPRYAADLLQQAQTDTVSGLARYVATALRLSTPASGFAEMRARMATEVASFDALRSYALFERPELRIHADDLSRMVRQFLVLLAVARGLFLRLEEFDADDARPVLDRLRPTLETIAAGLERLAADPAARRNAQGLRCELRAARRALDAAGRDLEALIDAAPLEPLVDGLLILNRVGELLHRFAIVVVVEGASLRPRRGPRRRAPEPLDFGDRREALFVAARAAFAMLAFSCWWAATGWDQGFTALSGGAIMLFFGVNQDNPQAGGRAYLAGSSAGIVVAYLATVFILPSLQGFPALAFVLLLLLTPAGLMIGAPALAVAGVAFGGWMIAEIGAGNVFKPNEAALLNSSAALVLGMIGCLVLIAALPVTSYGRRLRSRARTLGEILPAVARGEIAPRLGAREIVAMTAAILPRLAFRRAGDDEFFRASLGAASTSQELGRLAALQYEPATPAAAAEAIARFREGFAVALETLARERADRPRRLAEAAAVAAALRAELHANLPGRGAQTGALLSAAASLRFIADRLEIDRVYFEQRLREA